MVTSPLTIMSEKLVITLDQWGNLTITRSDCGGSIELSRAELEFVRQAIRLHGMPTDVPYHGQDDKGYQD